MKKIFYTGISGLILFEFFRVYFIMPFPGSQEINSIETAYFLHSYRWIFRILFAGMILAGAVPVFTGKKKWVPALMITLAIASCYVFNFPMTAEKMFLQPEQLVLKNISENKVNEDRLVIGVVHNQDARAYPISFIAYHHQVRDSVGGKPVMVTYCSVCRTGRVFDPTVKGKPESFRLVGMDHFNAMFEDLNTKSWWRQSTGEAVTGSLRGEKLEEIQSVQMTVKQWFGLYPEGLVMQTDEGSIPNYDSLARFEQGKSKSSLTRTDTIPWKKKSWVVGIQIGNECKAYVWTELKKKGIINDVVANIPVLIAVGSDGKSFAAFERPDPGNFSFRNDSLFSNTDSYDFAGRNSDSTQAGLKKISAFQEFWHSWLTFHPNTLQN